MATETPSQPGPSAVHVTCGAVYPQRDPPIFSGSGESDVDEWLSRYDKVGASNRWDDPMKLGYVQFYLADIAQLWYHNHEAELPSWSAFKTAIKDVFGRPAARKLLAEQRLRQRAQQPGETYTGYIEDVLHLCTRVDPAMPEEAKINHILKGIEDGAFQLLLARNPTTVAALVSLCQSFDELRRQRAIARQALPTPDTLSSLQLAVPPATQPTLQPTIKDFIREEVARQLSLLPLTHEPAHPLAPGIQQAIRTQVAEALPPMFQQPPVTAPLTYAAVAARPPQQPMPSAPPRPLMPSHALATTAYHQSMPYAPLRPLTPPRVLPTSAYASSPPIPNPSAPSFRRSDAWRTPDNRPICFSCGLAGHVARHCRLVPPTFDAVGMPVASSSRSPPNYAPPHFDADGRPVASSSRSPPEYARDQRPNDTHRSPSPRRRSLSPMRRRPAAQEGN